MKTRVVGLDFGSGSIKAVQTLRTSPTTHVVEKQAAVKLQPGWISDGRVAPEHTAAVINVLTKLWQDAGFSTKDVVIGLHSSAATFMSEEIVPLMKPEDMASAVPVILASNNPNLDPSENLLDWTVMEELEGEVGDRHLRMMVYSVRKSYADEVVSLVTSAGLTVVGADFNALAALRAVAVQDRPAGAVDVLVDIGAHLTTVLLHHNGVPRLLTLDPDSAGYAASAKIASALGLDEDDPEDARKIEYHKVNDDNAVGLVAQARNEYCRALASRISTNLESYLDRSPEFDSIAEITLVGGGALLHGLGSVLRDTLGGTPLTYAGIDPSITAAGGSVVERQESMSGGDYLVAIGLGTGARL